MKISRYFTDGRPVHEQFDWKTVDIDLRDGQRTVLQTKVEVPSTWSQMAAEILAHKYLRKAGVPSDDDLIIALDAHASVPEWLRPSTPRAGAVLGAETSAKQVFHRLAGHWTYNAFLNGYFSLDGELSVEEYAQAFYDELYYMLAAQIAAPNSPQWFNTGLWWAYGLTDDASGAPGYRAAGVGYKAHEVHGYKHPQTSACFILGLRDSLLGGAGILDTVMREARIFKYGSGSGVNYSSLRAKGSTLSNGGASSGLMSFLKLFDTNAGTIKSGGTTRRAARMAIVDCDHPEAEAFVEWKACEELKVAAMVAGAKLTKPSPEAAGLGEATLKALETAAYEGEAYSTVSGQNANNSLRVTHAFMQCATATDDDPRHTEAEKRLFDKTCAAAWACGDPGLQFHDTINQWHTVPKVAEIRASNPCTEFMFIDDTSCNLASINLMACVAVGEFRVDRFQQAVSLWTMVLDVSVGMSSYPDERVAENSVNYRAIGLGYANLGGLLISLGLPYDSYEGRMCASIITAYMHGVAWRTSVQMAKELGSFLDFDKHRSDVAAVYRKHKAAVDEMADTPLFLGLTQRNTHPMHKLACVVEDVWTDSTATAVSALRNAQLTLLAPTGTTGLVMDCATTGIEPDFSLVKHKKLAGGGSMTLANPLIEPALANLGYNRVQVSDILGYVSTTGRIDLACPHIAKDHIAVFECAGDISVAGHIGMMAAVQPFLSGAISKTVNMPSTATVSDVRDAYILAWKKGLKAVAIYRDGCKLSQPLTAVRAGSAIHQLPSGAPEVSLSDATDRIPATSRVVVKGVKNHTPRYKLPARRSGFTQKVHISGNSLYLRTGEYADGRLGEVFLNLGRDGSTMRHLVDSLAVCISLGLQHGVPLQEYVDAFTDTTSEPNGPVQGSERVRFCSSLMDYIVKELAAEYLHKEGDVPPEVDGVPANDDSAQTDWSKDTVITRIVPKSIAGLRTMAKPAYTGNACPSCGRFTLRRAGSCHVCDSCGETTGCS